MDFFNYAGIHRPVKLYLTPTLHLHDITLETDVSDNVGKLNFTSSIAQLQRDIKESDVQLDYNVLDDEGSNVAGLSISLSFHFKILQSYMRLFFIYLFQKVSLC